MNIFAILFLCGLVSLSKSLSDLPSVVSAERICKPGPPLKRTPGKINCLIIGDSISIGQVFIITLKFRQALEFALTLKRYSKAASSLVSIQSSLSLESSLSLQIFGSDRDDHMETLQRSLRTILATETISRPRQTRVLSLRQKRPEIIIKRSHIFNGNRVYESSKYWPPEMK